MTTGYVQATYTRRNIIWIKENQPGFFFLNLQILKRIFEKSMGKWISPVMGAQSCIIFFKEKFGDVYQKP